MKKPSASSAGLTCGGLPLCALVCAFFFAACAYVHGSTPWRSVLYPEHWLPPDESVSFYEDKIIQDFSYAGYRRGEQPIPAVTGPVFDVTAYGADPTGAADSTAAIQAAIDAAAAAGGGVVYLPAGEFRVAPQGPDNFALRIAASHIILRGAGTAQTFLLNTSHEMRSKAVIRIAPPAASTGPAVSLTADLPGPTHRIPLATTSPFSPGDFVRIEWSFTEAWIAEHNQQDWWNAGARPADARYYREVLAVNPAEGWIDVDVPTRYTMKVRDNARVSVQEGLIHEVGVEHLSIGNLQHPGTEWGNTDYTDPAKPAFDVHASWLIRMSFVRDGWVGSVHSYQPAANTSTAHMLSNGILLLNCLRVTVRDAQMRRPQYGGGGGNGYMYRVQHSSECLIKDSVADFSRHGFVLSHAGTSGNVFLRVEDLETQRATGATGNYNTGGSGSDHHMHFSHSNLIDRSHVHNSFFTAHHRRFAGTTPHGLTSAHGVFWNTSGSGTRGGAIVRSEQARYGYVIGTGGERFSVSNPTGGNTLPRDHVEGVGAGDTLEPASLYEDQLSRRTEPTVTYSENGATGGSAPVDPLSPYEPGATVTVVGPGDLERTHFTFAGWNTAADGSGVTYAPGSTFTLAGRTTLHAQWVYQMQVDAGPGQTVSLGGALPWTPALMEAAVWFDAADDDTLTIVAGGVSRWEDKSGNENHAVQATGANRPVLNVAAPVGLPSVSFRADDRQFLSAADSPSLNLDASGGVNVFAVFNYHGFVAQGSGLNVAFSKGHILFVQAAYGIRIGSGDGLAFKAGTETHLDAGTEFLGQSILFSGTHDDTAGLSQFHLNGELRDTRHLAMPIRSDNADPLFIGRDPANHRFSDVDFGEIVVAGGGLSAHDRQRVEGYLAHKWDLAENLPADHPYRESGPLAGMATATVHGSLSDAAGEHFTYRWSLGSGPVGVSFGDSAALSTTITFTRAGDYVLRLTIEDEFGASFDEVSITVVEEGDLHPFAIWAGDENVTFFDDTNGDGTAAGMAWLLGAENPLADATSLLPAVFVNEEALEISFSMLSGQARGSAWLDFEYSTDLASWITVPVPDESGAHAGVNFIVVPGDPLNAVTVTLPLSDPESGNKVFFRLTGYPKPAP